MKTINAENLKRGDVIHYPATTASNEKFYKVANSPNLKKNTVHVYINPVINGKVLENNMNEREFGRKVELEITE